MAAVWAATLPSVVPPGDLVEIPQFDSGDRDVITEQLVDLGVLLPPSEARASIWQGQTVSNDYLSTVAIFAMSSRYWAGTFCSGTLIHPHWVLTAAHCVVALDDYTSQKLSIYVGVGDQDYTRSGIGFVAYEAVSAASYHGSYSPKGQAGSGYDIGLLYLANPIPNTAAKPMALNATAIDTSWLRTNLRYVGFGITNDDLDDSGRKRTTQLPLTSYTSDMIYGYGGTVSSQAYQGGAYGTGYYPSNWDSTSNICSGDSGGSTYLNDPQKGLVLVGVNAIGFGGSGKGNTATCAGGGAGSTRVDTYMRFITDTLAQKGDTLSNTSTGDNSGGSATATLPDYQLTQSARGPIDAPALSDPPRPDPFEGCFSESDTPSSAWLWLGLGILAPLGRRRSPST